MRLLPIVPAPKSVYPLEGYYTFGSDTKIVVTDSSILEIPMVPALEVLGFQGIKNILQPQGIHSLGTLIDGWIEPLRKRVGVALPIQKVPKVKGEKGVTTIVLHYKDELPGLESYELVVTPEEISINASGGVGFFWAIQTLLQIVEPNGITPCYSIVDTPRFAWRGLHLDCGRHFQSVDSIKKHIDTMALHKLNIFHWHLTEDQGWRLEIKRYPKLTEVGSRREGTCWGHIAQEHLESDGVPYGGYYTQDDAREIVQHARNRGIMVVPEIGLPGHSQAAIAAYPELGMMDYPLPVRTTWGICPNIYNPEESTINFLLGVMEEVVDIFPSPWIHVGGDEAVKDQWDSSKRVAELIQERGVSDSHEMQSWCIGKMCNYLQSVGRKIVGWDEVMEGGAPEGVTVMAWRHTQEGVAATKEGLPVLMAPKQWTYLDYRPERGPFEPLTITTGYRPYATFSLEDMYRWRPIPKTLTQKQQDRIFGGQGQVWTEYMQEPKVVQFMAWPRASALAEILWSPEESRDYKGFCQRLSGVLGILDTREVAYQVQDKLKREKPLLATPQEQEFVIELDGVEGFVESFKRLQVHFGRWGTKGYGTIKQVALESADGRVWRDSVEGYVGDFNRLNVYTFGNGVSVSSKGATLRVILASCNFLPGDRGQTPEPCPVAWAWRAT